MTINVKNIDKEDLLLILYNNARPLGMGFLQAKNNLMSKEEAQKELGQTCKPDFCYIYTPKFTIDCSYYSMSPSVFTKIEGSCSYNNLYFDYLHGRPIKTDISGDEIDLWLYKIDNPHVVIENIISDFKESKTHTHKAMNLRPSEEQDYIPFFTAKLVELASKINPHTGHTDLSSTLAGFDLVEKCNDIKYDDSYSKKILISYDLYP